MMVGTGIRSATCSVHTVPLIVILSTNVRASFALPIEGGHLVVPHPPEPSHRMQRACSLTP